MIKLVALALGLALSGCAGTSFGIVTDGTFPMRPGGVDYPNWEHLCVLYDTSNATEYLNASGEKGWELVGLGEQAGNNLMCFKRPKATSGGGGTAPGL